VQCGTVSVLCCVTVCILVFDVVFVTYCSVVFMEGKDRQCSVAQLVPYCVTVCILVLVLSVLRTVLCFLWREQTKYLCCSEC